MCAFFFCLDGFDFLEGNRGGFLHACFSFGFVCFRLAPAATISGSVFLSPLRHIFSLHVGFTCMSVYTLDLLRPRGVETRCRILCLVCILFFFHLTASCYFFHLLLRRFFFSLLNLGCFLFVLWIAKSWYSGVQRTDVW